VNCGNNCLLAGQLIPRDFKTGPHGQNAGFAQFTQILSDDLID